MNKRHKPEINLSNNSTHNRQNVTYKSMMIMKWQLLLHQLLLGILHHSVGDIIPSCDWSIIKLGVSWKVNKLWIFVYFCCEVMSTCVANWIESAGTYPEIYLFRTADYTFVMTLKRKHTTYMHRGNHNVQSTMDGPTFRRNEIIRFQCKTKSDQQHLQQRIIILQFQFKQKA